MKIAKLSLPLLAIPICLCSSVMARDVVRVLRASLGGEIAQTEPIDIKIAPGHGVTLSFLNAGQKVVRVWLDNPTFVTVSADGCLEGLSNRSCRVPGAGILHLKRVSDLSLPGIPRTSSGLLTVVTDGERGRGIYLFRLIKAARPSALVYEIVK